MDRRKIDRWSVRHLSATAGVCVAQATLLLGSTAVGAGEQPEEVVVTGSRIRQNPVESVAPLQTNDERSNDRSFFCP